MKKLALLTLVTVASVSSTGCSGGWPRWFCRGDDCNTCTNFGDGMYNSPALMSPSYVSPPELPGPAIQSVPIPAPGQ
jgi:hypothetical protein